MAQDPIRKAYEKVRAEGQGLDALLPVQIAQRQKLWEAEVALARLVDETEPERPAVLSMLSGASERSISFREFLGDDTIPAEAVPAEVEREAVVVQSSEPVQAATAEAIEVTVRPQAEQVAESFANPAFPQHAKPEEKVLGVLRWLGGTATRLEIWEALRHFKANVSRHQLKHRLTALKDEGLIIHRQPGNDSRNWYYTLPSGSAMAEREGGLFSTDPVAVKPLPRDKDSRASLGATIKEKAFKALYDELRFLSKAEIEQAIKAETTDLNLSQLSWYLFDLSKKGKLTTLIYGGKHGRYFYGLNEWTVGSGPQRRFADEAYLPLDSELAGLDPLDFVFR